MAARQAHNLEAVGSSPTPAKNENPREKTVGFCFFRQVSKDSNRAIDKRETLSVCSEAARRRPYRRPLQGRVLPLLKTKTHGRKPWVLCFFRQVSKDSNRAIDKRETLSVCSEAARRRPYRRPLQGRVLPLLKTKTHGRKPWVLCFFRQVSKDSNQLQLPHFFLLLDCRFSLPCLRKDAFPQT